MNKSELVKIALVSTLIWCGGYGAAKADTAMLSASEVEALMSGQFHLGNISRRGDGI